MVIGRVSGQRDDESIQANWVRVRIRVRVRGITPYDFTLHFL